MVRFDLPGEFCDGQRNPFFSGNAFQAALPPVMPSQNLFLEGDRNPGHRHDRDDRAGNEAGDEMAPEEAFAKSHAIPTEMPNENATETQFQCQCKRSINKSDNPKQSDPAACFRKSRD
nr:hypothetical protein [Verrucomicrobium spinosum]